jgi:hypothetical protein
MGNRFATEKRVVCPHPHLSLIYIKNHGHDEGAKTMFNENACYEANDYTDILYFLSNSNINPHIDRIYFSCNSIIVNPVEKLVSILEANNYECKYDQFAKGKVYKRIRIFESNITGIKVSILYGRNNNFSFYPCIGITIYKPDRDTIDWFDTICNSIGFETKLSHVEVTLDFSPYKYEIHEFFWKHLFLKYNSGGSCFYDGEFSTFYIGHKRKNSKSVILYQKIIEGINILRLELRLNRAYIKKLDLALDCFEKINDINLSDLISFRELNHEKLLKHLMWKHKSKLLKFDDIDRCLLINQLSQVPSAYGGVVDEMSYMKKIRYLNNPQRFFDNMTEVNNELFGRLKKIKFI